MRKWANRFNKWINDLVNHTLAEMPEVGKAVGQTSKQMIVWINNGMNEWMKNSRNGTE